MKNQYQFPRHSATENPDDRVRKVVLGMFDLNYIMRCPAMKWFSLIFYLPGSYRDDFRSDFAGIFASHMKTIRV